MQFLTRFAHDFLPEDYGWHEASAHEFRAGFVTTTWLRWEIPFRYPAAVSTCDYDETCKEFLALYKPPFDATEDTPAPRGTAVLRTPIGYTGDLVRVADVSR